MSPLSNFINNHDSKFYIIGTHSGQTDTLMHEVSHALYYLNPEYKSICDEIYSTIPAHIKQNINTKLTEYGYTKQVFADETQAYLSSEDPESLLYTFDLNEDVLPYSIQYTAAAIKFAPKLS